MGCLRRVGLLFAISVLGIVAFSAAQAKEVVLTVHPDDPHALAEAVAKAKQIVADDAEGGIVRIELTAGTYRPHDTIELDLPASGSPWRVEIAAAESRKARFSGGTAVTGWQRVRDEATLARLPEEARGKVWRADLAKLGVTDFGKPSGGGIEFFFDDRPQTLARWPNEGFVKIVDVVGEQPFDVRGRKGDRVGKFIYEGDRPARWTEEKDPWVHGYWFHDWSSDHHPIARIDTEKHVIEVAPPYHRYGYRKGQWYYAYNLLCELDRPGEWYLDRETGELYFYPPEGYQDDPAKGRPVVSVVDTLLSIHDAAHVAVRGLVFEHCRATAVTVRNCRHVFLDDCLVRNAGSWGVQVDGGELCGVFDSDLYSLGDGGVRLSGGDRKTLTPGSHAAIGNDIHDYGRIHPMYQPGVAAGGVGILVAFNHIHHAPHQAIGFGGNEHTFVGNEIDHVCLESNDAGAVYSGRDWTQRGTVVAANYFHDINGFEDRGCVGVYLDDMYCGTTIVGNLFRNVTRAAFVGGGRDNRVLNNVFIDCDRAVHVDARALGWAAYHLNDTMPNRLNAMPVESIAWKSRYGDLANIPNDEPGAPKGNVIARNIAIGGRWSEFEKKAEPYIVLENNLVDTTREATGIEDAAGGRIRFADPEKVRRLVPGFHAEYFRVMGMRRDAILVERKLIEDVVLEEPTDPAKPITRWESTIAEIEKRNAGAPKDAIVFAGSSSIVRWDLDKWFPDLDVVNCGFGGSQINEVTYYAERILVPLRPRMIVFYAGDNDIAAGVSAEEVLARFSRFVRLARFRMPGAKIVFVAIKPSIARYHLLDEVKRANRLIARYAEIDPTVEIAYLDIESIMLGPDGKPRKELFVADGLHCSDEGYRLWSEKLRPYLTGEAWNE